MIRVKVELAIQLPTEKERATERKRREKREAMGDRETKIQKVVSSLSFFYISL